MWVLWSFPWSHSLYSYTEYFYCIVLIAMYDVRSSHIGSIQTGLKPRLLWDWSAVIHNISASRTVIHTISASRSSLYVYIYTCKIWRFLVRVAVYQPTTIRGRMIRVGVLMYGLWFAQNPTKQLEARQRRQNQVYLAFSSQKQVRCDTGQSQGSWRVIYTWF